MSNDEPDLDECADCGGSTAPSTPDPHVCELPPVPAPVCARCLGIEPGKPGGTPEDRLDDTRFTPDLCDACKTAIDAGTARVLRGVGTIINLGDRWPWPMVSNARREGLAPWFEVCERVSNDQRDVVPPLTLRTRTPRAVGFFTGEPAAHDERGVPVHAAHIAINGRHFVREVAIDQIDQALSELITALTGRAS